MTDPDPQRAAKKRSTGPFAPPSPKTAEKAEGGEPMAVAGDKANTHGESFVATSSPRDAFDHDIARKFGQDVREARSESHTRAEENPKGYTKPDAKGWAKPQEEEE